jgi:hypothetical protein
MLHRCPIRPTWLAALAGVALSLPAPRAQAADDKPDSCVIHLQICLYELREAKEDLREVKGLPEGERKEIQGGIDDAIEKLKRTVQSCGGKVEYSKPKERPNYPDFKHLRHAITSLKTAREQLKTQDGVPPDVRDEGLRVIDKCLRQLDCALDRVR